MPKYTNLDIAAWFIRKEKMNHEKLQCLLYLAYAWYEALYQEALFIRKEKMNHEKLQCLLYLAYAWYEAS